MINFKKIDNYYFVFSDKDIWKYWPFESLWVKWLFEWNEFLIDVKNLKSWKHTVWYLNWICYFFEENKGVLKNIWIVFLYFENN